MIVNIDKNAGFCSGVKRAIKQAEMELEAHGKLYCLGQIVHNEEEEKRLQALGLEVIDQETFADLHNVSVLIRAHGEPPETYRTAELNNINLIDATCPVVEKLQKKIKKTFEEGKQEDVQVVIYGKKKHPEVIGLNGQIQNEAILVEGEADLGKINFSKPVCLFAQTTKSKEVYNEIIDRITKEKGSYFPDGDLHFKSTNSICGQVSNRDENLKIFARDHELIIFVGGEKSSNGKYLFSVVKAVNPFAKYVGGGQMLHEEWFVNKTRIGVTGATSTPQWLLEDVAAHIANIIKN